MSKLHIELLSEIDNYGIGKRINISPFMDQHFQMPKPTSEIPIPWDDNTFSYAVGLLYDLKARNLIDFENLDRNIFKMAYDQDGKLIFGKWFSNTEFYITFTIDALNYLQQYRLNLALLDNMKVQKRYSYTSIIVAGLSVIVAMGAFFRDKSNGEDIVKLQLSINQMQKEQKLQQSKEKTLSNPRKVQEESYK